MTYQCKSPVLLISFNRKNSVIKVLEQIRLVQPQKLYLASDGARETKIGEKELINEIRNTLLREITWKCEIFTLFRDKNLGCKKAVSESVTWFFKHEEMGIILEDDCLPNISFFNFCDSLLEIYKNDTRVQSIGGCNPMITAGLKEDYFFSNYNRIWGWASWRRSWAFYNDDRAYWEKVHALGIPEQILGTKASKYFNGIWQKCYSGEVDTWDYQWFLSKLVNGLTIVPKENLVCNIGFNEDATHTTDQSHHFSSLESKEIEFPIKGPTFVVANPLLEEEWFKLLTSSKLSIFKRVMKKLNLFTK